MSILAKALKDALTGADNETYDYLPLIACVGALAYVIYAGLALIVFRQPWEPVNYGAGLGAVLGAAAAAQRWRDGPQSLPAGPSTTISGVDKVTVNP